jgi:thiol-disulfide isomerase/thioredoxin
MKRSILALTAVLFVLAACGKKEQPAVQADSQTPGYTQKDTYFKLPNAAGGEIDLAAYAGKPVLVMFFTETCPYCRKAAPFIQKVSAAYAPKGLGVIGICLQDDPRAALNFASELGVTFPLAYKGKEISRNYRTQGVPYIYALTRQHEIYDVWEGYDEQYDQSIVKAIGTVLGKK